MTKQRLVFISGPIASGKTTVARRMAALVRSCGEQAASIDMDEMVSIVAGTDWSLVSEPDRERSREIAAALAQRLFEGGYNLVAVAGSTVAPHEWQQLESHLTLKPHTVRVLLRVSVDESIRRAIADPARNNTKNPDVVRRLYARIDWSAIGSQDIDLLTDGQTIDQVVHTIDQLVAASL